MLDIKALEYIFDPAGKEQAAVTKHSFALLNGGSTLASLLQISLQLHPKHFVSSAWKETELHRQFIRKLVKLHTVHLVCGKFKLISVLKA